MTASSSALTSPSPALVLDEHNGRTRSRRSRGAPDDRSDVYQRLDRELDIENGAKGVSEGVSEEMCHAGVQMTKAATAKTSNHRRAPSRLDENDPIVDFDGQYKYPAPQDIDEDIDEEEDFGPRSSSSGSPQASNDTDLLTESDGSDDRTSAAAAAAKDDPHYFDTDFEDTGNASDLESVVDRIEYIARSFSGLSFLSDLGVEDPGDKDVLDIEEKVLQEYGLEYIQKFEQKMGDVDGDVDGEPNNSSDGSNEDRSGEDDEGSWRDQGSPLKRTTTATTAEILVDIINAEREGKEVEYDPTRRESSARSIRRSLESIGLIRNSSHPSFKKKNISKLESSKLEASKEIKIRQDGDALATRAAAAALASSLILDDTPQEEDDANTVGHNSVTKELQENVVKDQGTGKSEINRLPERIPPRYSFADADKTRSTEKGSSYSYADTDEALAKNSCPPREEKITMLVDTTQPLTESFVRDAVIEERVLDPVSDAPSSCDALKEDASLTVREQEQLKTLARNYEQFDSASQHEHQNLEIIHNPDGPLIRLPSYQRSLSFRSSTTRGSSAYYENKEVVYDPTAFDASFRSSIPSHSGRSEREIDYYSSAMVKKHNSCCDLRSIAGTLRTTKSHQNNHTIEQFCAESVRSNASSSKSQRKVVDKADYEWPSLPDNHHLSSLPSESEGFEMQLMFDCFKAAESTKRWKKKEWQQSKLASNGRTKPSTDELNRPTSRNGKLKFLDPERLLCGLKQQQPRKKGNHLPFTCKKAKEEKENSQQIRRTKDPRTSELNVLGAQAVKRFLDEDEDSFEKEKAHNISMETATTAAMDDEDEFSQFQSQFHIEVNERPYVPSNEPLISALLEENRTMPAEHQQKHNSNAERNPPLLESLSNTESDNIVHSPTVKFMDETKINVTTEIQESDPAYLPGEGATAEANPIISCPVEILPQAQTNSGSDLIQSPIPVTQEAKSNYGGELVDLLHKISSYVDGIVEKNNYSIPVPSTPDHGVAGNKKDGNEADDENSHPKMEISQETNSIVSSLSGATPVKQEMMNAIYVPTKRTPEKAEICKTALKEEEGSDGRAADLLSLFDNSLTYSESSQSNHKESPDPRAKTPTQSLLDDEISEDSSAIMGSSVDRSVTSSKPPQQRQEEDEEEDEKRWEVQNPVIYHMKSSPPKSNRPYRATQKRTIAKRPGERYPMRLKAKARDVSSVGRKANSIDQDDDDLFSVGSLPYRCIKNPKPTLSQEKVPPREENFKASQPTRSHLRQDGEVNQKQPVFQSESRPSQPSPRVESTHRGDGPSYKEKPRPPTPPKTFREKTTVLKAGFDRTNAVTTRTIPGGNPRNMSHDGNRAKPQTTQSNRFVVDENGFLVERSAALLGGME